MYTICSHCDVGCLVCVEADLHVVGVAELQKADGASQHDQE